MLLSLRIFLDSGFRRNDDYNFSSLRGNPQVATTTVGLRPLSGAFLIPPTLPVVSDLLNTFLLLCKCVKDVLAVCDLFHFSRSEKEVVMNINRRSFLQLAGAITGGAIANYPMIAEATSQKNQTDSIGCLMDISLCIGCRKCEMACNEFNKLAAVDTPFDDFSVLEKQRRPVNNLYTVVNRYYTGKRDELNNLVPGYTKINCMHCQSPGCVSACITGAMSKKENGTVHYDVKKCIGCRYCIVACPFQIPTYEYEKPLMPEVRKCTFCWESTKDQGGKPACSVICPVGALTYGKREHLVTLAHQKIHNFPDRYVDWVYGEHEVGGTAWLYISKTPFNKIGFIDLPEKPVNMLIESIQHGLYRYLWSPLAVFTLLGGIMLSFNRKQITGVSDKPNVKEKK